jgi:hypothetical protein
MVRFYSALVLAGALSACAIPAGGSAASGAASIPSAPINLGNWRAATEAATLTAFESEVSRRYGAGLALPAVSADLRAYEFNCGAAPQRAQGNRGDPPAQVCRRTVTANGCTHTWQVHLFDAAGNARLVRTRALYDRRCGGDGLLGGPG